MIKTLEDLRRKIKKKLHLLNKERYNFNMNWWQSETGSKLYRFSTLKRHQLESQKKDENDASYTEEKLKRQAKQTIPQNKRKLSCKTALSFSLK